MSRCYFLPVVSNAVTNICVSAFVWVYVFMSRGQIPSSAVAGSHDKSGFKVLGSCHAVLQSGCTPSCFLTSSAGFQSPHPCLCLLLVCIVVFNIAILVDEKEYLIVVLFASPWGLMWLNMFSCSCWPLFYMFIAWLKNIRSFQKCLCSLLRLTEKK